MSPVVSIHVVRQATEIVAEGQLKKERQKRAWSKQVEEESVKVGLRREESLCRSMWMARVNQIAAGLR